MSFFVKNIPDPDGRDHLMICTDVIEPGDIVFYQMGGFKMGRAKFVNRHQEDCGELGIVVMWGFETEGGAFYNYFPNMPGGDADTAPFKVVKTVDPKSNLKEGDTIDFISSKD